MRRWSPIDELVDSEEVIRIRDILSLNFSLLGLKVVSASKSKLGKVADYITDSDSWDIYQLIVQRPIMKSLLSMKKN